MRIVLFCNESSLPAHLGRLTGEELAAVVLSPGRALPDAVRALLPPRVELLPYPDPPDFHSSPNGPPEADGPVASGFLARLAALAADLFVVHGFSKILPRQVFALPPRGSVNLHGGPLPAMRGANVVNWAVALGMRRTEVTLHEVARRVDAGPVIASTSLPIGPDEDARALRDRLIVAGVDLLHAHLPAILAGRATATAQDESAARLFPRRTDADGRIDWNASAREVHNLVRALVLPWPGAHFPHEGGRAVLRRARVIADAGGPGAGVVVTSAGGTVAIGCGRGMIAPIAAEWNGSPVAPEDLFAGVERLLEPAPAQIERSVLDFNKAKGRFY